MTRSPTASRKAPRSQTLYAHLKEDYPLQGTPLDVPLPTVLAVSPQKRTRYIRALLTALEREIAHDRMALKRRVPFKKEMRDLRKLLYAPADQYLYTDDTTFKPNVLAKGSPGSTHTFWSRTQMWKMKTNQGDLAEMISHKHPALVSKLDKLFDATNNGKKNLRNIKLTAVQNALIFLQWDKSSGTAFPPFHAKYFADKFLPQEGEGLVIDPCAGWGGRLLGTLSVKRAGHVRYIGIDPEKHNKPAYEGLLRRLNGYLRKELTGTRSGQIYYRAFEDWVKTPTAKKLYGKADLVITSPPYFSAENYNPANAKQSANRYSSYEHWREGFYCKLIRGAFALLKPGGTLVLNIADVASAKRLEKDARQLAHEAGFTGAGFYKLAMSVTPGTRKSIRHTTVVNGVIWKSEPVFVFRKPTTKNSRQLQVAPVSPTTTPVSKSTNAREQLKEVFRRYKSSRRNPYSLFSTRITAGLKDKTLRMCKVHGAMVAAFLASRRKAAGKGYLYAGTTPSVHAISKCAGDLDIDAISLVDNSAASQQALLRELKAVKGPAWAECVASDQVVSKILSQAGFAYVTSKVDALSDVLAIYFKGTAEERQHRTVSVDPAELVNLKRLPVGNVSALVQQIAARLNKKKFNFTNHNSNYNRNDAWSALSLHGYLPDPTYIHDPEEAKRGTSEKDMEELKKWERRYPKRLWGLQDTPLMKQFPEVQELLNALVPNSSDNGNAAFKRVRLMRLKPQGGELTRHTDLTDGTLGLDDGKTVRIHFPIKTNPKVLLTSWNLHDHPIQAHFKVGECWYLNIRLPHKIINGGSEDRFHLVVDAVANERLRALIGGKQTVTREPQHTALPIVDKERLHNALRAMGRKWLHKKTMKWSPENPTHNYCYVVTEWYHRFLAPEGSTTWKVKMPGDPYIHRFNKMPDGTVHDLTSEQFLGKPIPYEKAKQFHLLKTGGPQPSRRAQLLNHRYNGGTESTFEYRKRDQDWRALQQTPENLLGDWTDPNPAPVIEEHQKILVVRDDLLGVGSKIRFLDYLVKTAPEKEFVFGASNKVGYGAISLSYLCRKYRKKAVFFMAKTSNPTWHQKRVKKLGGKIHWIPDGMLVVCQARARAYAAKDPKRRRLLPIGLEDETVLASIVRVARGLTYQNKPVVPTEIWSVGSSGTLSRGLQAAFPKARVHVVQTGHSMSEEQIGRAILHKSKYKFDQRCKEAEMPPYNSEPFYDSKVWAFIKKHGKPGALLWNVA